MKKKGIIGFAILVISGLSVNLLNLHRIFTISWDYLKTLSAVSLSDMLIIFFFSVVIGVIVMSIKSLVEEVAAKSKYFKEELVSRDKKIHEEMKELHKSIKEEYKDDLKEHMEKITILHKATNVTITHMAAQLTQLYTHVLGETKQENSPPGAL